MPERFIAATNDVLKKLLPSFSLSSPDSFSRLSYVERAPRGYVQGTWLDGNTHELAVLRVYGVIRDASVGPYGVNAGLTRALWNVSLHSIFCMYFRADSQLNFRNKKFAS